MAEDLVRKRRRSKVRRHVARAPRLLAKTATVIDVQPLRANRPLTARAHEGSVGFHVVQRGIFMVRFKSLVAAAAASALVATPAFAAGNSARSLSVARAAAPAKAGEKIAEGSTATIVNIGILAALAAVVLLVVADDEDSSDSN